jgi:uncharacterized protein (TIGR02271 family)
MSTSSNQNYVDLTQGMEVFDAAGDKVGKIINVTEETIVVEKGFFFPKDYVIPYALIAGVNEDDHVILTRVKDDLTRDYETDPALFSDNDGVAPGTLAGGAFAAGGTGFGGAPVGAFGAVPDAVDVPVETGEGVIPRDPAAAGASADQAFNAAASDRTVDTTATGQEAARVPVYEEQVTPVKHAVERGAVRIQKEVVTENRTVTVPVTEERVRITRVDADQPVSAGEEVLQGDTIDIPVRGEEVDLEKTVRQTGEILVEKDAVQHDETVSGTVRREKVRVDDDAGLAEGDIAARRTDAEGRPEGV